MTHRRTILGLTTVVIFVAIAACASSGIIPIGDGVYSVTKHSATTLASGDSQKADVYREANAYCAKQGREIQTVEIKARNGVVAARAASAELHFRCVATGPRADH
jgi:hypothetical protein